MIVNKVLWEQLKEDREALKAELAAERAVREKLGDMILEVVDIVDHQCPDADAYLDGHCSLREAVWRELEKAERRIEEEQKLYVETLGLLDAERRKMRQGGRE